MLTLDKTTLYFTSLSQTYSKDKDSGLLDEVTAWASQIPPRTKPKSGFRSTSTPSLTNTTSRTSRVSAPSARSAFTNNVKVAGTNSDEEVEIIGETGFVSDHDELFGNECEVALKSPPKTGRRASSSVSPIIPLSFYL